MWESAIFLCAKPLSLDGNLHNKFLGVYENKFIKSEKKIPPFSLIDRWVK